MSALLIVTLVPFVAVLAWIVVGSYRMARPLSDDERTAAGAETMAHAQRLARDRGIPVPVSVRVLLAARRRSSR